MMSVKHSYLLDSLRLLSVLCSIVSAENDAFLKTKLWALFMASPGKQELKSSVSSLSPKHTR